MIWLLYLTWHSHKWFSSREISSIYKAQCAGSSLPSTPPESAGPLGKLWGFTAPPPHTPGGPQWKEGNRKQGANTYMSLRGRTKTIYRLERDRSLVWLDFCTLWRTVWFMCWSFLTHKAVPVSHIIWEWEKTDFRPTHPSWRKRDTGQGNTKLRKEEYY